MKGKTMMMNKSISTLSKTAAILFAVLLCTALFSGCNNQDENDDYFAERAAELLAAGQPTIHDSKEPFTLGGISGEPTEEQPWWTLEYGNFPVILSSVIPAGLAENFAEAHIGYPDRDKDLTKFVASYYEGVPGSRDILMEHFLERNEEHVGGDMYDYQRGIRFESAAVNLLLLTEVNQNDRDYFESKGGKAAAEEIARAALIFMAPADFPTDNLTLEQLKDVLSG